MSTNDILERASNAIAGATVFGPAHTENGLTVIPAAKVRGGGGGGGGKGRDDESGEGGGFGLNARPAGALVIKGDSVRWKMAPVDLTKIVVGAELVAIAYFVFTWLTAKAKAG